MHLPGDALYFSGETLEMFTDEHLFSAKDFKKGAIASTSTPGSAATQSIIRTKQPSDMSLGGLPANSCRISSSKLISAAKHFSFDSLIFSSKEFQASVRSLITGSSSSVFQL